MGKYLSAMRALLPGLICLLCLLAWGGFSIPALYAQGTTAEIQGRVTDITGAVIPGATITATNLETGLHRTVASSSVGLYVIPNLPPGGRYRVQVSMPGFQTTVREGFGLVVGQQLVLNVSLQIGEVAEQVTVTGEAPLVNVSTAQVSGLVGEQAVRELPLNGRSFDNLITLNPGMVNTTALKGATSGSSGPGNYFSVAGRRPGSNKFLWNGIEYPGGTTAQSGTPGGVSGQLLGIDAVREFNVVTNIDSAEYGHRMGGQITVVTASGTNTFHGTLFHFLRNSALDARNFFDPGGVPSFKRNQFGGSAGGPIRRDKTFLFGNYEGFRQRLGLSSVAVVPDAQARKGFLPDAQGVYQPVPNLKPAVLPYFALWPEPNGPPLLVGGRPTGTALALSHPSESIREEFGIVRLDHIFSDRDTLSGSYTVSDGEGITPQQNPLASINTVSRAQLVSLTETHVFSPTVVNRLTIGFSRVNFANPNPLAVRPSGVAPFVEGSLIGRIAVGGGTGGGATAMAFAGNGPNVSENAYLTNLYTFDNQVSVAKNIHSISVGGWFTILQNNAKPVSFDRATFADLTAFLQGRPEEVQIILNPERNLPWRMKMGAWYVQDTMRLSPKLTFNIGLRHEFTNGWGQADGQAANFLPGPDGFLLDEPRIGKNLFTKNRARFLLGPRAGLAWDPLGDGKTSIRAGWGIAYGLLDSMHQCCSGAHPANITYQISNWPFPLTVKPSETLPPGLIAVGGTGEGGVQEDAYTPALINYRLEIERGLGERMSLRLAFIGSRGYHDLLRAMANPTSSVICSAAQGNCPAGLADGTRYYPPGARGLNPRLGTQVHQFTDAFSRYNGFLIDLNRRFGGGFAVRANYTFGRSLDNGSSLSSPQAIGNPPEIMDPLDRRRDYGLSAFDVRNRFSFSGFWELPFGAGRALAGGVTGVADKLVSGWQLNTIINVQGGFPLTPRLGFNRSGGGRGSTTDRPDMAPGRTLHDIYDGFRTPERWFDPTAFALPAARTLGNVGRNVLIGPGLATVDMSVFKTTRISERWATEFRAEVFNLLNRANFGIPSPLVLESSGRPRGSASVITNTTTTSRQMQFGLRLRW